jgi:hypothetical protein
VHLQLANNFLSDSVLVAAEARHDYGARFSANLRATWFNGKTVGRNTDRGRTFDEAQQIILVGVGGTWRVTRSHHVDLYYDGILELELQDQRNAENVFIHMGMLRYSWLF